MSLSTRSASPAEASPVTRLINIFRSFPLLPAFLLFLSELAELLLVSPRIRLLEASICRRHYDFADPSVIPPSLLVPEDLCKIDAVQTRLAYIRGWQVFWEAIPVMLLAVPWGALADRVGRKKVLAVNFLGCALHILWFVVVCRPGSTLPPEAVWASGVAFMLGGGPRTGGILILALVTDTSTQKKRSERFYYTYSAFLLTELIAPPFSAALMRHSLLTPFSVALAALTLSFPVLASIHSPPIPKSTSISTSTPTSTFTSLKNILPFLHSLNPNIPLLLLLHFLSPLRQELTFQILLPYTSLTFSLPLSTSGLLLSLIAFSNLISITLLLPYLSHRLLSPPYSLSPLQTDVKIAQLSCILLSVSCVFLGAVRVYWEFVISVVGFAAGFGVRLAVLSALTGCVRRGEVGRVYAGVTVVEGVGEMVSAPVLQGVWAKGLDAGGWRHGGVWWVGAVGYAVGAWVVGRVRERPGYGNGREGSDEDGYERVASEDEEEDDDEEMGRRID